MRVVDDVAVVDDVSFVWWMTWRWWMTARACAAKPATHLVILAHHDGAVRGEGRLGDVQPELLQDAVQLLRLR